MRGQIDRQCQVPVFFRLLTDNCAARDAGVVEQNIEAPVSLNRGRDDIAGCVIICDVLLQNGDTGMFRMYFRERRFRAVDGEYIGAFRSEELR